jgi:hypothetical protein
LQFTQSHRAFLKLQCSRRALCIIPISPSQNIKNKRPTWTEGSFLFLFFLVGGSQYWVWGYQVNFLSLVIFLIGSHTFAWGWLISDRDPPTHASCIAVIIVVNYHICLVCWWGLAFCQGWSQTVMLLFFTPWIARLKVQILIK